MNPILEKVTPSSNHSFALKEDILTHIEIGWHFHPEYELTLIAESYGKRVVGDHIANFEAGDLLFIGPNLPHYMRNDAAFYEGDPELRCRAIVAHFAEDFMGETFFHQPELHQIQSLLQESLRGIHIYGETAQKVSLQMEQLLMTHGFERLLILLDILSKVAKSTERHLLASSGFTRHTPSGESSRIGQIFAYMFEHFSEDISLSQLADQVNMTDSAFCKLIKRHTGKTFSHTLNEIRIGHACRLLIESEYSIGEVAYLSGYSNPSYFNRKFRSFTDVTPLQYRYKFRPLAN